MRLRRLPEIDLAEITARSEPEQRLRLLGFEGGGGGWSYEPARDAVPDVFHAEGGLDLKLANSPLDEILKKVARQSQRGIKQRESNCEVTEVLFAWARSNVNRSAMRLIPSLGIGQLGLARFWANVVAEIDGRPTVMFFDHRRSKGLTSLGRRVVLSVMHEHIRVVDPDLAEASLRIFQFPTAEGIRFVRTYEADGLQLFEYDELLQMFQTTYRIWAEVCDERRRDPERERRAAATGTLL